MSPWLPASPGVEPSLTHWFIIPACLFCVFQSEIKEMWWRADAAGAQRSGSFLRMFKLRLNRVSIHGLMSLFITYLHTHTHTPRAASIRVKQTQRLGVGEACQPEGCWLSEPGAAGTALPLAAGTTATGWWPWLQQAAQVWECTRLKSH